MAKKSCRQKPKNSMIFVLSNKAPCLSNRQKNPIPTNNPISHHKQGGLPHKGGRLVIYINRPGHYISSGSLSFSPMKRAASST